jgi:hypothetical protein
MAITPTTPAAIRDAVVTAVRDIAPDHGANDADVWMYAVDEMNLGGRRTFTVINDPESHAWAPPGVALQGGDGTSWVYEMRVRVSYAHLERSEVEDMAMSDAGALWETLHPRSASGGALQITGLLDFAAGGDLPRLELVLDEEDGGPIYDHVFSVHYLREHDRNG